MGIADDFLALPFGLKLLLGFVLLLGGSVKFIPFVDLNPVSETFGQIIFYGLGQVIFAPFTYALSFLGLSFTFELFVILYGLILVSYWVIWILQFVSPFLVRKHK